VTPAVPPPIRTQAPALAPTAPPPSQPPPLPGERQPAPAAAAKRPDLERFIGLAVLGRVGAAALLLAAAYFGQLGWTRLGPMARVLTIYAGGAAMIVAGTLLRLRVVPRYTAILWGAGTALTYLGGTLACLHYELLPPLPAMVLLFASAALGQWLGRLLRLEAFATVALAGAYAAPVLVGTPSPTPTAFFALLVLLHSWAAWTQWRWAWHWARGLAVLMTTTLVAGWYGQNGITTALSTIVHLEAVLLCVTAPEWLAAFVRSQVDRTRWLLCLAGCSAVQFVLLFVSAWNSECLGFGLISGALLLAAAARLAGKAPMLAPGVGRLGGVLVVFGAVLVWPSAGPVVGAQWVSVDGPQRALPPVLEWQRIGSLSGTVALLLLLRRLVLVGELAATLALLLATCFLLAGWPTGVERWQTVPVLLAAAVLVRFARPSIAAIGGLLLGCGAALFGLCHAFTFHGPDAHWLPIALAVSGGGAVLAVLQAGLRRDRGLLQVAILLLAGLSALWIVHALGTMNLPAGAHLPLLWNVRLLCSLVLLAACLGGRRVLPVAEDSARAVLAIAALAIGYCGGLLEVITAVADLGTGWSRVATSLYTLVFASALLAAGFARRHAALRWTGLVGFGAAALKVTLFDLANVDTPLRVLAAGGLGAVLLLAAYAYARTRDRGQDKDPGPGQAAP
jgi:uncharacterized membrane protein